MNDAAPDNARIRFLRLVNSRIRFPFFLLFKLPSAFFAGVRVRRLTEAGAEVTVPYTWLSQNPFRSTYFACLAMAAEMSTGLLAMLYSYRRQPPVSMLVTHLEAVYHKKATGLTRFVCTDGEGVAATLRQAIASGEGQTFRMRSAGYNHKGELIAEFYITWSFKVKATGSTSLNS